MIKYLLLTLACLITVGAMVLASHGSYTAGIPAGIGILVAYLCGDLYGPHTKDNQ